MLVYIAGPFTNGDRSCNIAEAEKVAAACWSAGHIVICPHANTANMETLCPEITYQQWLDKTIELLKICEAIVFTPRWRDSHGAQQEYLYAYKNDIPMFFYPNIPAIAS